MATGAFASVNRRRAKREKDSVGGGGGGNGNSKFHGDRDRNGGGGGNRSNNDSSSNNEKLSQHQPIRSGFGGRPSLEWDYGAFNVVVAKADENAIGQGLEKMISERRLVASYNWDVDSWIPTIVVPGAPKVFYPWPGGRLEIRNEVMTIDEESFRIPNSPMEPLFTAVRLCQPDFKLRSVDLVADLNCLKKLLRFVLRAAYGTQAEDGGTDASEGGGSDVDRHLLSGIQSECDFRIDCQMIGRTVVLMRRESEHRGRAMGFGVGYLDASTKPYEADPNAAGPHKRITFVKFGSLRMLLRHKVLAAIYPEKPINTNGDHASMQQRGANGDGTGDQRAVLRYSAVRHVRGGFLDDHKQLKQIEFASISKERKSPLVVDKWLDMLFIGSENLYYGEHVRGRFDEPTMRTRPEALELSGLKPSDGRRILVILEMLLDKIVQFGRRSSGGGRQDGRNAVDGGGGDNKRRQLPTSSSNNEPISFTLVSRQECRKLLVFKNGPSKRTNTDHGNRSDMPPPPCVSESMMTALLADD